MSCNIRTSTLDRNGCTDTDSDGWSDPDGVWTTADNADAFINEPTQWSDSDGDGYGDNAAGVDPDHCPGAFGTSTEMGHLGCPDADGDGYSDTDDEFPSDDTQWIDADNDGFGENPAEIIPMFALVFKDIQIKTVSGVPILTEMDIRTKIQLVQMVLFGQ